MACIKFKSLIYFCKDNHSQLDGSDIYSPIGVIDMLLLQKFMYESSRLAGSRQRGGAGSRLRLHPDVEPPTPR